MEFEFYLSPNDFVILLTPLTFINVTQVEAEWNAGSGLVHSSPLPVPGSVGLLHKALCKHWPTQHTPIVPFKRAVWRGARLWQCT